MVFVWDKDFSDVIKYVHNKQATPIQFSEVDGVKGLCKMRDGVLFSDLSRRLIFWTSVRTSSHCVRAR